MFIMRLCRHLIATASLCALAPFAAPAQTPDRSKWDVDNPPLSAAGETVSFDVTSGTWMSLDVSPDGEKIVFDLLGDIYVIPLRGGPASKLTSGVAWDMQPRFSPNGREIAFTSDRAGGDNIWIMKADGSDPRQITKESFRLLNNPTWSPDGRYIAARKHFTTARSLGTGEIWLYHKDGGDGIQLVARPNAQYQKELGEPMFAPDGKRVYFTQNSTPGNTFIYAQDSNSELFQIRAVNLDDGSIDVVAGGPGGAVRPTPSPDGRYLAFVKRVRAKSRLFVRHLDSGIETMLVDQMDQDNQETWAVQGVYPNMDWTPDSENIVYWAKGKLWRVDLQGRINEIPFRVQDERTVFPAVRRTVDVAPDQFDTKMVRFARRSPDGEKLVFESLGKLYVKTGEGNPVRLTTLPRDMFEMYPVWTPDSQRIYFATWNDQKLGGIFRVKVDDEDRSGIQIDTGRGHFVELDLSPDGRELLYRKREGGYLLSPDWDENPGIYLMQIESTSKRLISEAGQKAYFAPDYATSGRIHAMQRSGGKTRLLSMNRKGHDIRTLAESQFALDMRVSPDGRYLAFQESYHLYAMPWRDTGQTIQVGPKAGALPLKQISRTGASYPHWSADGKQLNWSIGPVYKSVDISRAFGKEFRPPRDGTSMSMRVTAAKPAGRVALVGARIITMDGDRRVIEGGTIVIDGNRIESVGTGPAPEGVKTIDAAGKTIIPGLIDIHAHGPYGSGEIIPQQNWSTDAHLALGVTTLHNPSSRAHLAFPAAELQKAGLTLAPRIFSTGEIIYGAKQPLWAPINSLDDALAHVRRLKAQGAISVKNYNQPRREQRQMVVEAARQEGLFVVAEGGALYHMDMNLVVDGNTGVEHTLPNQAIYDDVLQFWPQTKVGLTPTLVVGYGGLTTEHYFYQHTEVWKHPLLSRFVPPTVLQPASVRRPMAPEEDYADDENAALAKQLMERGVTVSIGAHGQREGLAAHWEMWGFARGGMSPLQALETATVQPAAYFGMSKDIGSLEAGKLADLVVLNANPLDNIRNSDQIAQIMLNGRLYDALTLDEVATGDRKHQPYYWSGKRESEIR